VEITLFADVIGINSFDGTEFVSELYTRPSVFCSKMKDPSPVRGKHYDSKPSPFLQSLRITET
jgi:hypothetical protein